MNTGSTQRVRMGKVAVDAWRSWPGFKILDFPPNVLELETHFHFVIYVSKWWAFSSRILFVMSLCIMLKHLSPPPLEKLFPMRFLTKALGGFFPLFSLSLLYSFNCANVMRFSDSRFMFFLPRRWRGDIRLVACNTHSHMFNIHEHQICVECNLESRVGLFMAASLYFCLPNAAIKVNLNGSDELHDKWYRREQMDCHHPPAPAPAPLQLFNSDSLSHFLLW